VNPVAREDLARLRAALDDPGPVAVPDVAAIIAEGRRARTRKQVLAAVVAVAAVAIGLVVPAGRLDGSPVPAPDPGVQAALAGGPAPALLVAHGSPRYEAPTEFDPLTRTLAVGWVPDGLDGGGTSVDAHQQHFGAFDDAYRNGGPDIGLAVTVLSRGRGVEELPTGALGLPRWAEPRPTDPVQGSAAQCLSDPAVPTGTCTALRWEYAPDAWAQVSYAGSAGPTPETAAAVARRVAESVSLSVAEPVRLPFSLTGRLGGLRPIAVGVAVSDDVDAIDGSRWSASVDLAPVDPADRPVQVRVSWFPAGGTPGSDKYGEPNTTVDGNPASFDDFYGDALLVWEPRGITVSLFDVADPVAAYDDVALVDDPFDPAGWVVLR
jgi:hypothetical protein